MLGSAIKRPPDGLERQLSARNRPPAALRRPQTACHPEIADKAANVGKIFFDTEFTGLSPDARLISIGLVDEAGQSEF